MMIKEVDTFVSLKHVVMTTSGAGIFLGTDEKIFLIYVDTLMGQQIQAAIQPKTQTRPLTFDVFRYILRGFDIDIKNIVIYNEDKGVFFTKVVCHQQCEQNLRVLEMDIRPSDAILLSLAMARPIYISNALLERLPDASNLLKNFYTLGQ